MSYKETFDAHEKKAVAGMRNAKTRDEYIRHQSDLETVQSLKRLYSRGEFPRKKPASDSDE